MATTRFILRKDKFKKKTNKYPLYLLITEGKKNTQKSLGIDLSLDEWDEQKEKVRGKHQNSGKLNIYLSKIRSEVEEVKIELEGHRGIGKNYKKKKNASGGKLNYFDCFKDYIETLELNNPINTSRKARAAYNYLKEFNKSETLTFREFNVDYFKALNKFFVNKNLKANTISSYLKIYKRIFKQALREGKIKPQDDSSGQYKITWDKVHTEFLTEEQIIEIFNLKFEIGSKIDLHRDIFIFACYAGGIRIGDLLQLEWKNYNKTTNKVSYIARKNGVKISFKLPEKAKLILEKYSNGSKNGYIFPLLPNELLGSRQEIVERKIQSITAMINKNLKKIALEVELDLTLHFHHSRHSFGCLAYQKGIGLMEIKEIMGHEDIKSTMVYAKLVAGAVDNSIDKIDL